MLVASRQLGHPSKLGCREGLLDADGAGYICILSTWIDNRRVFHTASCYQQDAKDGSVTVLLHSTSPQVRRCVVMKWLEQFRTPAQTRRIQWLRLIAYASDPDRRRCKLSVNRADKLGLKRVTLGWHLRNASAFRCHHDRPRVSARRPSPQPDGLWAADRCGLLPAGVAAGERDLEPIYWLPAGTWAWA